MPRQIEMDADMRQLMDVLGKAIVPRSKRKTVYREHLHTSYYSRGRFTRL